MKKLSIILVLIFIISACSKDENVIKTRSKKTNVTNATTNRLRTFEGPTNEEIINTIQSFQANRTAYNENQEVPNYLQKEALFQMPLVLNYEMPIYGYYYDLDNVDLEISILNSGTAEDGSTILSGSDMFSKYQEVEDYITNNMGEKALYAASFKIKETNEDYTIFEIHIIKGISVADIGENNYLTEFPILPIGTEPYCPGAGTPFILAKIMKDAYNANTISLTYVYRAQGLVLVDLDVPMENRYKIAFPGYSPDFLFHSDSWVSVGASTPPKYYMHNYYLWANTIRASAIVYGAFARYIDIGCVDNGTGNPSQWVDYRYTHYINLYFSAWKNIPELFTPNN